MFHSAGSLLTRAHPWLEGQRFSSQSEGPGFPHLVPRAGVTVNLVIGSCRASSFCVEGEPTVIAGTRCGQFQKNGAMRKKQLRMFTDACRKQASEKQRWERSLMRRRFSCRRERKICCSHALEFPHAKHRKSTAIRSQESGPRLCNTRVSCHPSTESQGKALQPVIHVTDKPGSVCDNLER